MTTGTLGDISQERAATVHVAKECAPRYSFGGVGQVVGALAQGQAKSRQVYVVLPHYAAYQATSEQFMHFRFRLHNRDVDGTVSVERDSIGIIYLYISRPSHVPGLWNAKHAEEAYNCPKGFRADERDSYFTFVAAHLILHLRNYSSDISVHVHGATNAPVMFFLRQQDLSMPIIYTLHDYVSEPTVAYRPSSLLSYVKKSSLSSILSRCPRRPSESSICRPDRAATKESLSCFSLWRSSIRSSNILNCADYVTAVSQGVFETLLDDKIYETHVAQLANSGRLRVINNWVNDELWKKARQSVRIDHSLPDKLAAKRALLEVFDEFGHGSLDGFTRNCFVSWSGRFEENKGAHMLHYILDTSCRARCVFVIAGYSTSITQRKLKQALIKQMNRQPACPYMMFDSLVNQANYSLTIRAASDITVVPSRSESFGLVAAEALAFASLPIVSDVPGLRDIVVPYKDGVDNWTGFRFHYSKRKLRVTSSSIASVLQTAIELIMQQRGEDISRYHRRLISAAPHCREDACEWIRSYNVLYSK